MSEHGVMSEHDVMSGDDQVSRCGYVAIVGRPNVGKSTLLNRILGQKISITSKKPQTTRHQVLGIHTEGATQAIYVDTPGIHLAQGDRNKAINRYMNDAATSALRDVDLVVFIVDRTKWTEEDELVFQRIEHLKVPVILALNKVDWLEDKAELLPFIQKLAARRDFAEVIPISAIQGDQVSVLEQAVAQRLPESIHYFPDDQVTDRSQRFLAAELVREKIMRSLGNELPYQTTVEIEQFKYQGKTLHIHALILVEREGQKKIIIGEKGERIRQIGRDARVDMQDAFESKVMLNLWVKVKRGWSDDDRALKSLGFDDLG